jgi:hypothetical protein
MNSAIGKMLVENNGNALGFKLWKALLWGQYALDPSSSSSMLGQTALTVGLH